MSDSARDQASRSITGTVDNRRQYPRVSPDWLDCDVGEILDISLGGAMLRCKRKLRGNLAMRIWNFETGLVLQARVVWTNPICFRHHEIGVVFQNVGKTNFETLKSLLYPFGLPDRKEEDEVEEAPDLKLVEDGQEIELDEEPVASNSCLDELYDDTDALHIEDEDLRRIVDAWPHLPGPLQLEIMDIIRGRTG